MKNDVLDQNVRRILFVYPEPYFVSAGGIATYLHHAVRAHQEAGRDVHLLTWMTPNDAQFSQPLTNELLAPLDLDHVTLLRFDEGMIEEMNPVGIRGKNISDLLFEHVLRLEAEFRPDVIEGSDYGYPLHTYLQKRMCGAHLSKVPVVTFNHGLLQDIFPASANKPTDLALREMVYERQVLQWCDRVFAPSNEAAARLAQMRDSASDISIVREPFTASIWQVLESFDPSRFIYFGRVSFAKGVDIFAGMMTAIEGIWPVSEITFLGRQVSMPFRRSCPKDYLKARLHPSLHGVTCFLDAVDRAAIGDVISRYGFFANFSRSETFSYTTLEALSRGVVPLILTNSPMAELLPESARSRGTFREVPHRAETIEDVLAFWRDNYSELMRSVQAHARSLTEPARYARAYDALTPRPIEPTAPRFTGHDVSILMTTHNDADLLEQAVLSANKQTVGVREIIVLDDGTTKEEDIARLEALARKGSIRLIRVRNMGLVAGRNVLVENAVTELVIFLDSDDLLAPTFVEKTLRALNADPGKWAAAITRRKNFGLNEHEISCFLLHTPLHWLFNDLRMTALIKKSVLQEIRFDPGIRNGEADDWWWWLRFSINGHRAVHVPEGLFHYRTVAGSMSVPWSQGQGALTIELLKRAAREAAGRELNLVPILEAALELVYKRTWEADSLRAANVATTFNVYNNRVRIHRSLSRLMGERRVRNLIGLGRRAASAQPWLARPANYVLRSLHLSS
jgi:glycosyltransferase involved in cell wall biosynthesis